MFHPDATYQYGASALEVSIERFTQRAVVKSPQNYADLEQAAIEELKTLNTKSDQFSFLLAIQAHLQKTQSQKNSQIVSLLVQLAIEEKQWDLAYAYAVLPTQQEPLEKMAQSPQQRQRHLLHPLIDALSRFNPRRLLNYEWPTCIEDVELILFQHAQRDPISSNAYELLVSFALAHNAYANAASYSFHMASRLEESEKATHDRVDLIERSYLLLFSCLKQSKFVGGADYVVLKQGDTTTVVSIEQAERRLAFARASNAYHKRKQQQSTSTAAISSSRLLTAREISPEDLVVRLTDADAFEEAFDLANHFDIDQSALFSRITSVCLDIENGMRSDNIIQENRAFRHADGFPYFVTPLLWNETATPDGIDKIKKTDSWQFLHGLLQRAEERRGVCCRYRLAIIESILKSGRLLPSHVCKLAFLPPPPSISPAAANAGIREQHEKINTALHATYLSVVHLLLKYNRLIEAVDLIMPRICYVVETLSKPNHRPELQYEMQFMLEVARRLAVLKHQNMDVRF